MPGDRTGPRDNLAEVFSGQFVLLPRRDHPWDLHESQPILFVAKARARVLGSHHSWCIMKPSSTRFRRD
jgi:hypothetical protein